MTLTPRSEIYDTYWKFACERQAIFMLRLKGQKPPLTTDPILQAYKFCNVYRATDRVSQFLIREVIYGFSGTLADMLLRIFLFRLLNRIQTWQELEKIVGRVTVASFDPKLYSKALDQIRLTQPIYGSAFILCANKAFGFNKKQDNHLALLADVFGSSKADKLIKSSSLQQLFSELKELPLVGDFMAYQLAIDFNYSEVFDFSENDFTVAGPGALRGIAKCFEITGGKTPAEIIMYMVARQEAEFERLGLKFQQLGDRPLQAIDCQGLFCEVDKYCRVKYPKLASNRVRIKAKYNPDPQPIQYFFPPKWGISSLA